MSGAQFGQFILGLIVVAVVVAIAVWLLNWLYLRSSKERAFVRTGLGGQKVVMNGGAFVLPIVHEVVPVNMNTLRLEVTRGRDKAIITQDRMRVDVTGEFYVRVQASPDAIASAAQTLGQRTLQPELLKELVEGKFVDALRTVAAEMTMEQMHEKRGDYVKRVRAVVAADLLQNGLELETVSLTQLDQTAMEFFNPSNAFDAEGLTRLTEQIERRKKTRNDIEQDTMIQIRNKNLETERQALDIDRELETARLDQEREVETQRSAQRANVAQDRASKEQETERAQIAARESVDRARLASERAVEEERISKERDIQSREIERRQTIELAEQQRAIKVAQQSKAQSEAQAAADQARAKATTEEEKVFTARETEMAERRKKIELIGASQEAERDALRITVAAGAEKAAASDRGAALRMDAEAAADADKIRSMAAKIRHEVEAEGASLMNKAQNLLSPESRQSAMRIRLIDKLEGIIRESVKPMEKIEGIKILQVDGLGGGGGGGGRGGDRGNGGFADSVVDSALRYRAQAPLVDQLLREIGVESGDVGQAARGLLAAGGAAAITEKSGGKWLPVIKVYTSSVIEAPADAVWAQIRDFNGLPKWTPFVAESRIEGSHPADKIGCVRNFRLKDGGVIREQLLTLSDYDYECSYSILESPMGVENYVATLKLTPVTDGNRTFAEWSAEFDCAPERERELAQNIGQGVFQAGFESLKALLPQVIRVTRSAVIDAPIARVWEVLRDFNSHWAWHPAVGESQIEGGEPADQVGCVRNFFLKDGNHIREQLLALSDKDYISTYCILDATLPMKRYVATVRLKPVTDGARTFWHWQSTFDVPRGREKEFQDLVGKGVYEGGFEGLRSFLRRGGQADPIPRGINAEAMQGQAVVATAFGGPEVLRLESLAVKAPGPGEVRLRQTAVGVNYIDVYVRKGQYRMIDPPAAIGMEAAGVVLDVGDGVAHLLPGDRVAYACPPPGAYATVRTMAADQVVVLPDDVNDETAAAVMLKGMTAEYLLHRTFRVRPGHAVLVHAAAGGVGLFLCQWAKALGAKVIGTVSSEEKARLARANGCDFPIVTRDYRFAAEVKNLTNGRGADVIYDGLGREAAAENLEALAFTGHWACYGQASGAHDALPDLGSKSGTLSRPVLFHYTADRALLNEIAGNVFRALREKTLRVAVNHRYPLGAAAEAHRDLEARRTTGALVLLP